MSKQTYDGRRTRLDMIDEMTSHQCVSLFELAQTDNYDAFEAQVAPLLQAQLGQSLREEGDDTVADEYESLLGQRPRGWEE